jgi:uncharacterized protein (TIGR00369 family)
LTERDRRERTITWSDPVASAAAGRDMPGIDFLRAMMSGAVAPPPFLVVLGAAIQAVDPGRIVMRLTPDEFHYNPYSTVHGGVLATMLDSVMSCAILSLLPRGRGNTTIDLTVNFLRPLSIATGPVDIEGTVTHTGRTTAVAQGRVTDAAGALYAVATTTCLLVDFK